MIKKLLVVVGLFVIIPKMGFISCEPCGPFPDKFKVTGMEWDTYKFIDSDTSVNETVYDNQVDDTMEYDKFGIAIKPITELYYSENNPKKSLSLIQSVNACSPIDHTTNETIDSIVIMANQDYNSDYSAGSDLSGLFDIVVMDPVNYYYNDQLRLSEYVALKPNVPSQIMTLVLREKPDSTAEFEFMVQYYQDGIDFDYFEFTTKKIVIPHE